MSNNLKKFLKNIENKRLNKDFKSKFLIFTKDFFWFISFVPFFYLRKFIRWIFKTSMGNQNIKVIELPEGFKKELKNTFLDYKKDFEKKGFKDGWVYAKSFGSYTHYVYAIISYYKIRSVYEVGTYRGNTVFMILNYFINNKVNNFFIHSIDIKKWFDEKIFSKLSIERFKQNENSILLEIGDSNIKKLEARYDLAIIDGNHTPKAVLEDFATVENHAKFVFFDDLNLERIYEDAYLKIIKKDKVKEIFRIYTSDMRNHHCSALVKIENI